MLTVERDGTKVEPFGSNPIGYMIFTASGHFAWNLMRADRPKFASGNRATGTVEENKAAVQGNIRGRNHSEKDYLNQWGSTKVFHSNRVHWWFVHQYTDTCQVRC
jgi:Lipocalin-like domain